MERLKDQENQSDILASIESKQVFTFEQWTKASQDPDVHKEMIDILEKTTFEAFTFDNVDTNYSFIKCSLKMREVWMDGARLDKLYDITKEGSNECEVRSQKMFLDMCAEEFGEKLSSLPKKVALLPEIQPDVIEFAKLAMPIQKITGSDIDPLHKFKTTHGQYNNECHDSFIKEKLEVEMHLDRTLNVSFISSMGMLLDNSYHEAVRAELVELLEPYISKTDGVSGYYRGPVKSVGRMGNKIMDYVNEAPYPRAAKIIDPVRATIGFESAEEIMTAFNQLSNSKSFKIVRYKNKYNKAVSTPFRCVMMNILFEHAEVSIVGELQLTTTGMLHLKKIQHKFYDVVRCFEDGDGERDKTKDYGKIYEAIIEDVCK